MNKYFLLFLIISSFQFAKAQDSVYVMAKQSFDRTIPYFPLLENADIKIKIRSKGSAMAASYSWWSVFRRPAKRRYFVKVNRNVQGAYMCFQFDHLAQDSRDGVLGHELAHVDFFYSLNFFGFLKFIINQGLPGGIKKSERATDYRTVEVGLGKQLRSWSNETRTRFSESSNQIIPERFSSRYLTPQEIDSVMALFPTIYK